MSSLSTPFPERPVLQHFSLEKLPNHSMPDCNSRKHGFKVSSENEIATKKIKRQLKSTTPVLPLSLTHLAAGCITADSVSTGCHSFN